MLHDSSAAPDLRFQNDKRGAQGIAGIIALTLVGVGLRFYDLGARDFWFDESCTHAHVRGLFDAASAPLPLGERPLAAYYGLVWAWTRIFGESEIGYRSLSMVASSLTIPILGLVGRRLGGSTVGWVAALLAAINPLSVYCAREARPYACWMLLLSGTLGLLVRAAQQNRRKDWALYGAALLLTLHFHAFTIWWAPFSVAITALAADRRSAFRRWLITLVAVGGAYLPMGLLVVVPVASLGSNAWIGDAPLASWPLLRTLYAFLPAGDYPAHLRGLSFESPDTVRVVPEFVSHTASFLAPAIFLVLAAFTVRWRRISRMNGVATALRNPLLTEQWPNPGSLLAALTLGPLLLIAMYSYLGRPCYVVARYDLVAWPAFMVWLSIILVGGVDALVSTSVASVRRDRGLGVTMIFVILCAFDPLARLVQTPPGLSFARSRAVQLSHLADPADLVLTFAYDRAYLAYYLDRSGFSGRIRSFPSSLDEHLGWVDTRADLSPDSMAALPDDAAADLRAIAEIHRGEGTVWLLLDSLDPFGHGPRGPIHRVLREALDRAGYHLIAVDERLLIVRVEPPPS